MKPFIICCRGKAITVEKPTVMAILNATTDSFYDGRRYNDDEKFMAHARQMVDDGADILDIGAASSRPGAPLIDPKTEQERLLPLVKMIRSEWPDILISIDTYNAATAEATMKAGADIINDISGGMFDNKMFDTVADLQVPYVLSHTTDTPERMRSHTMPEEPDAISQLALFFSRHLETLYKRGAKDIILDPGFGFGKTLEQNYQVMNELERLQMMGLPVLVGVSRKSMIYRLLGIEAEQALNGTTVLNTIALRKGASILRVHDVREAVECVRVLAAMASPQRKQE